MNEENEKEKPSFAEKAATLIVDKRKGFFLFFILAAIPLTEKLLQGL